jgi:hypothetical protein
VTSRIEPFRYTHRVVDSWVEALTAAWSVARGARSAELHGQYVKSRDARGLHPYSVEVGRVLALQELEPALSAAGFDPVLMRREAESDAYDGFVRELMEGKP